MNTENHSNYNLKLIRYGILLFLFGLITGFVIPAMQNPRMGLSSHLEGILNGILLIVFGLIWSKLILSDKLQKWTYSLALFGTFTNWLTILLAAIWGAGSEMMPIAGMKMNGNLIQEITIKFGLLSLSISMIVVCLLILWGLKEKSVN